MRMKRGKKTGGGPYRAEMPKGKTPSKRGAKTGGGSMVDKVRGMMNGSVKGDMNC